MAGTPENTDKEKKSDSLLDKFKQMASDSTTRDSVIQGDFFRAVKDNNADMVRKILATGLDPDTYNGRGQTALHVAAINNATEAAQVLIEYGANPRHGERNGGGRSPIEDAINFNKPEMVKLLAMHGGYVSGDMSDDWSLLHRACEKGKVKVVEALLNAGVNGNEVTASGSTPLLIAINFGYADIVSLLLQFPDVIEQMNTHFVRTDDKKRTAFHLAIDRERMPIIAAMIEKGVDVNTPDVEGKPPLLHAIDSGNIELARLLVEAGADLNQPYKDHGTPLAYTCITESINDTARAAMVDLLIRLGADTDIPSSQDMMTPLHLILKHKRKTEVLEALLRYPVDKELPCPSGEPPLMIAAMYNNVVRAEMLLGAGANVNARSRDDARTALIQAVIHNNSNVIKLLLRAGANPRFYDGHGKSALSYARAQNATDIIKILEQALNKQVMPVSKPSPPSG